MSPTARALTPLDPVAPPCKQW